eukprot:gb/GFBE01037562.1/.p1 GENE.gb/GFBE01037562.1/~~gb/GFBE01037562.1/.p1  ORF type:complete len:234 (+),score=17.63 gb/GFBE01037562.1/:1-702(+)
MHQCARSLLLTGVIFAAVQVEPGSSAVPSDFAGDDVEEEGAAVEGKDESWRSQPRANTGTINPYTCYDTDKGADIQCFDFSTASCSSWSEEPCDCQPDHPVCVSSIATRSSPASLGGVLSACCSKHGTATGGVMHRTNSHIREPRTPFANWEEKLATRCFGRAISQRGTLSLADCKKRCLLDHREVAPTDCDAIVFKSPDGSQIGKCNLIYGLDPASCESKGQEFISYLKMQG